MITRANGGMVNATPRGKAGAATLRASPMASAMAQTITAVHPASEKLPTRWRPR